PAHACTVTVPYWSSWVVWVVVGAGQVVGRRRRTWRRGGGAARRGRAGTGGWAAKAERAAGARGPPAGAGRARWRVGVKAAVGPEPHQHRHPSVGQVQRQLGGVVAGGEHKTWDGAASTQPFKQRADLGGGGLVGVLQGSSRRGATRAVQESRSKLSWQIHLVGPAGADRLAARVAGGV